jgi:hypothetical protein
MPVRTHRTPRKPRRSTAGFYGSRPLQNPPEWGNKAGSSSLWQRIGGFLKRSSVIFLALCMIFGLLGAVTRVVSPEYIVTVQQFEISPAVSSTLSITGKGASDLVIDFLNRTGTDGSSFEGSDYYLYDRHGTQPVALKGTIRIPVENSYGIEVNGISLDNLRKLYDRIRYQQWIISGDIVSSPDGVIAKIRLDRDGSAKSWQTDPVPHPIASKLVENATALMLAEENPELLGRAYLKQRQYTEKQRQYTNAAQVFQQWALRSPRDWKPFYYLSLAYDYAGEEQEASTLAQWSKNIMKDQRNAKDDEPLDRGAIDTATVSDLAEVTQTVWETRDALRIDTLSKPEKTKTLETVQGAAKRFKGLSSRNPKDPTYKIQHAKALDQEAALEASLGKGEAYEHQHEAVHLLGEVAQSMPNNGGLHEQNGILMQHLVTIAQKEGKAPQFIQNVRNAEIFEFTKALELQPTNLSPLWAVVYALLESKRTEEAVNLSRTVTLLQPESTAAHAAYIVSLEHAMKETGRNAEQEKDLESHLKPVLENANKSEVQANAHKSEMQAVLYSFVDAADLKNLLATLQMCRELAKASPQEHLPDVALTLKALGDRYRTDPIQYQPVYLAVDIAPQVVSNYAWNSKCSMRIVRPTKSIDATKA